MVANVVLNEMRLVGSSKAQCSFAICIRESVGEEFNPTVKFLRHTQTTAASMIYLVSLRPITLNADLFVSFHRTKRCSMS